MGSSEFIGAVEEHVEQVVERCSHGEGLLLADAIQMRDKIQFEANKVRHGVIHLCSNVTLLVKRSK